MGRQESPQLIERETQVDTDAQETSRASKYYRYKVGSLVYSYRTTIKACWLCIVLSTGKFCCKNVAPKLHEILYSVIKCINFMKASPKTERLFQKFCETNHADHR